MYVIRYFVHLFVYVSIYSYISLLGVDLNKMVLCNSWGKWGCTNSWPPFVVASWCYWNSPWSRGSIDTLYSRMLQGGAPQLAFS